MKRFKRSAILPIIAMTILASCGLQKQEGAIVNVQPQVSQVTNTGVSTTEATGTTVIGSASSHDTTSVISTGAESWEKRLVTNIPYEKYTLTKNEISEFSKIMGVVLPKPAAWLGDLFLNVDWNSKGTAGSGTAIADSGRKISLGFRDLYSDDIGGWGRGFVEYSTYDFSIGTEYTTYATKDTFDSLNAGKEKHVVTVDGIKGIVTYKTEGFYEQTWKIQKVIAFPFHDHYIAIVYTLSGDYSKSKDRIIAELHEGKYPKNEIEWLKRIDDFVSSLKFTEKK